jgi:copper transport protein
MKRIFIAAVFLIAMLLAAPSALAHANLLRSDPPANSAQPISPTRVRLWFSETPEPSFTTISVLDKNGVRLDNSDSHRVPDEKDAMEVSVPELPEGLYTVNWKALSAVDGHVTTGSFSFTVGDVPLSESSPREIMGLVDNALAASQPPPLFQVLARWLNLLTLVVLVGALAFPILVLLPAIAMAEDMPILRAYLSVFNKVVDEPDHVLDWYEKWLMFVRVAFVLYVLASVGILLSQAIAAGGGLDAILNVLQATRFGTVWLFRISLLVLLGVLIFRDVTEPRAMRIGVLLGIGLVFTQSLTSHGAAVSDPPILPLAVDFVHLLVTAIWVGGLVQLLIAARSFDARTLAKLIATFSLVAFTCVGVLIATGAYSMIVQVGSLEAFFDTAYGTTLFTKFLLILPLLALGALNLIVNRPALPRLAAQRIRSVVMRFNIAVALEIVLAALVILVVGVLTSLAPAIGAYDPSPKLLMQTRQVDDLNVTLGIAPGLVGSNDFDVKVRDQSGAPVSNASVVRLLGDMTGMEMGAQEVETGNQGNGHYTLHGDLLSMIGMWNIEVLVRRENRYDARTTFEIPALAARPSPGSQYPALAQSDTWVGLGITLFAFAFGVAVVLIGGVKPKVRYVTLAGAIVLSALGAILLYQASLRAASQIAVTPIAPEFARVLRSPVRGDPPNLSAGSQIYAQNCAVCHGTGGKGDGPSAAALSPKPFDLTVHSRLHTEGELYWWVTNGIAGTAMPAWQSGLNDLQRWQVVAFIRTLGLPAATPQSSK